MAAKVSKGGPIFAAETGPPDRFFFVGKPGMGD